MAQDLIIGGKTYSGVEYIKSTKTPSGTAQFIDTADIAPVWDWRGVNAELVSTPFSTSVALSNTDFNGWTPSTTAQAIVASQNLTAFAIATNTYDYLIEWQFTADIAYVSGTSPAKTPYRHAVKIWQGIFKRPSNYANLIANNFNGNVCATLATAPVIVYYSATGVLTAAYTSSYGFYPSVVAAAFSSSTSNTPNLTIKTPTINARCNTTYMTTDMAALVDQANSTIKCVGKFYRMEAGAMFRKIYAEAIDLYLNPI